MRHCTPALAVTLAFASATPLGASAQEVQSLEEIVVTAQKRAQSMREVPLSVAVVGGETIEQRVLVDLADLSRIVPNVSINNAALNNLVFVRGIGSGSNVGFEQSVGLFVDEVYLSRVRYMRAPFLDIERVEVLRGPQGTLFGRNTIAGAISVTSAAPTAEFFAEADALYDAELESYSITGVASGPLSERLRGRLALRHAGGGTYVDNSSSGADGPEKDELAGRMTLALQAGENVDVTLRLEHSDFQVEGSTIQIVTAGAALPRFQAADPAFETQLDEHRSVGGLTRDFDRTRTSLGNLRIDWHNDLATFTSLSAFATYDLERNVDTDFSPLPFLATLVPDEQFDSWSQELRLASTDGAALDWMLGVYAERSEFATLDRSDLNGPGSGVPQLAPAVASSITRFDQEADVLSAYGQVEYHFTEAWSLAVGLRWNKEEKDGDLTHTLTELGTLDTPLANATARAVIGAAFGRSDAVIGGSRSEDQLTPSTALTWRNDDLLLYVRYAEGFKAGGFNGAQTAPVTALNPFEFDPEEARSFEIGGKWAASERLELNAAVFHTDYENLQVSVLTGTTFAVGNAAEARSRGVELDARWRAANWLTFSASGAYLDAEYDDYRNAPCPSRPAATPFPTCTLIGTARVQDLTGERLIYAPEWSGSVAASIDHAVSDRLRLVGLLAATTTSSFFMVADNDPLDRQSGYTSIDLRLGLAGVDDRWEVALVGRNLTDEDTSHVGNDVPGITGAHYRAYDQPRSIAIQARFRN
jgi:outer membrane receptor protein involved in Fe transport